MKHTDVIVIGGGHAGCEAAHAAARMGARVVLVTLKADAIGVMSCNPAIGGLGKGHLVREIDALDGVMGRVADAAGIQFRLLNRRKGPAVQGPRAQADRDIYRTKMQAEIAATPLIEVIEGEVTDLVVESGAVCGVRLADETAFQAAAVILTAGTFLRGKIHIGPVSHSGGRVGEASAARLGARLADLDLPTGRLKTGTPPRLDGRSIRWDELESQPGDDDPELFSFLSKTVQAQQISCGITHTTPEVHQLISENLHLSAMYGGQIGSLGPRYCPSIEDKIHRFADKGSHQIFLEPEGLTTPLVYPNGISTSLAAEVQTQMVAMIPGLEQAKIVQPGYAIEYDFFDPRGLDLSLEVSSLRNLFFAGQINGTTGYEEAAAQGLVAGLNAARRSQGGDPVRFDRTTSYIGVMIDDLTAMGVTEPYRMFTSRAEFRLSLRADNADRRLTAWGREVGCVGDARWAAFCEKQEQVTQLSAALDAATVTPRQLNAAGMDLNPDGGRRSAYSVLAIPGATIDVLREVVDLDFPSDPKVLSAVENDGRYAQYIERQQRDVRALQKDAETVIPHDLDFEQISGLSHELRSKLVAQRPGNLAQAGRIEGMTPAALLLVLGEIRRLMGQVA